MRYLGLFIFSFFISLNNAESLNFSVKPFEADWQGYAPWCWASSVKMVLNQKGIRKKTCEIVSDTLGRNCCSLFSSGRCFVGGTAGPVLARYGVSYYWKQHSNNEQYSIPVQAVQDLIRAIRQNKLAIMHFKNTDRRSFDHLVVAHSALDVERLSSLKIVFYDPAAGEQTVPAHILLSGYYDSQGNRYWWDGTWLPK